MDSKVKQRLVGALVLIGMVMILVPIIFHSGNMHADTISLTPIAPPAPEMPAVEKRVASHAKKLADMQQIIFEHTLNKTP